MKPNVSFSLQKVLSRPPTDTAISDQVVVFTTHAAVDDARVVLRPALLFETGASSRGA